MSTISDESLQGFQSTVSGLLGKATSLAGLALGPAAAIGFAGEAVFRLIRLGFSIKRAQEAAGKRLDEAVRLLDIPREAIVVDLTDVIVDHAIRDGTFEARFPQAAAQFQTEIAEFLSTPPLGVPKRTFRLLAFAHRHVPALVRNGRLQNDELQEMFGRFINPGKPDYRRIIGEMEAVLPSPEFVLSNHLHDSSDSFRRSLKLAGLRLDGLTQAEQESLNTEVRQLVEGAVLGDSGLAAKAMSFTVGLKTIHIDAEIAAHEKEQAALDDTAPGAAERKAEIARRIDELKKWKERLG